MPLAIYAWCHIIMQGEQKREIIAEMLAERRQWKLKYTIFVCLLSLFRVSTPSCPWVQVWTDCRDLENLIKNYHSS
jgi:hypothetical protein